MTEENDEEKEAAEHVDKQLTFLRGRIDMLREYGLEMEDFLFMEGMVGNVNEFPLFKLYRMAMQHPDQLDIHDAAELTSFIQGCIIGYAAGLKNIWPDTDVQGTPV
jgi:hypothetical protein